MGFVAGNPGRLPCFLGTISGGSVQAGGPVTPASFQRSERVTGRKARGLQVAGGNKLQVADFFSFLSLHKIKRGFFYLC